MINNQEYWDQRFRSGDWRENKGTEQTLFHYKILLKYMPEWLKKEISNSEMSICDLGCGTGEGVNLFKRYFKDSEVTGVDFSDYAIKEAKSMYSDSSFICSDITKFKEHYDVIVSSHTLEHFQNSYEVFSNIINLADKYFILVIPFQEEELFKEHFNSFDYNFFPLTIQDYSLVHFKEIDKTFFNPGKYWANEQIMVIYANTKNLPASKFSLDELNNNYFTEYKLAKERYEEKVSSLNRHFEDLIGNNKNLESTLTHEQKICEDLIEKNKSLESSLTNQQRICDDLIEKNNDTEFSLVREYNKTREFKELSENHLSQFLSEQKKCEGLMEKNKNLESDYKNLESTLTQEQGKVQELKELSENNLSQFLSEQKKCEGLMEKNKNLESSLISEHCKVQELKELSENNLSKFLSEQKKCELLIKENKAYKSRKIVRFADKLWKFYYMPKSHSYIAINKVYGKLKRFPKITTLIHKTNNKFNIINKEAALETYKKHQNIKPTIVTDIEPKTNFKSVVSSIKPEYPKDIKVAVILDEFSYNCFKQELNTIVIEPSNWLKVFETEKPDLFFCESAWNGADSKKMPWRGQIYSSVNFNYENRIALLSILAYCKKHNIPTIFWNKEDPAHYEDKVYNFVDTALKFDHIFTTSEECVQRYKKDHGHKSVQCLILDEQPKTNVKSDIVKPEIKLKPAVSSIKPKYPKDIKVAVILDEFSYNCFKHEFNAIIIEPSNWLKVFETEKPDLFFCESAWSGVDSKKRPWRGQIYSSVNFNYENRTALLSILDYCKKHNIPTIFWNKEDPTHYEDKVNNFVDTALKFDHIFTTSEECVQRYKKDHGHKSVHCLMFAGQPQMFNPIEKRDRTNDIIFAGSWYKHHPQRCIEMKKIFDNILNSGYDLKIYDRTYGTNDPKRIFPEKYRMLTNPTVPFDQIEKVYKESIYSLNINTETKSKTMFARRVFELMLCNTLVLSNYSKGMDELFGDDVIFVGEEKINLSKCEEKRTNNLYNVLKNHTYSKRFNQILDIINYEYMPTNNEITMYYIVNDQSEIKDILKHYESINYPSKKLTLLLSESIPNHLIKNVYQNYASDEVSVYSLNYLLQKEEVSSTLNKLGSYHGNPQCVNELISNETPYFIFANLELREDFVEKGILHYSYIETDVGIAPGEKFTFKKVDDVHNVIFHKEKFIDVFNSIFRDTSTEFTVYTLQEYKPEIHEKLKSELLKFQK